MGPIFISSIRRNFSSYISMCHNLVCHVSHFPLPCVPNTVFMYTRDFCFDCTWNHEVEALYFRWACISVVESDHARLIYVLLLIISDCWSEDMDLRHYPGSHPLSTHRSQDTDWWANFLSHTHTYPFHQKTLVRGHGTLRRSKVFDPQPSLVDFLNINQHTYIPDT